MLRKLNARPTLEANISSQYTKKFAELSKFLNENKKHISTHAKKNLF